MAYGRHIKRSLSARFANLPTKMAADHARPTCNDIHWIINLASPLNRSLLSNTRSNMKKVIICLAVTVSIICTLYILWPRNRKVVQDTFKGKNAYELVKGEASTPERSSHDDVQAVIPSPYKAFLYPKSLDKIWLYISKNLLIRRVAYLDRIEGQVLRFITIRDRRNKTVPSLYAKLYYPNAVSPCLKTSWLLGSIHSSYYGGGGYDDFIHFLLNTKVSMSHLIDPLYATLSTDSSCKNESAPISVLTIQPNRTIFTYGVCLHKSLRNNVSPQTVLDWVKLNIALGAEIVTVYFQTVSEEHYKVLEPYVAKGIVEVLDWKVERPFADSPSLDGAQTGVIAECLWYNMDRVKYLGLMDVDEFFVPQKHRNMQELLSHLDTNPKKAALYYFWDANMYDVGKMLPKVTDLLDKKCQGLSKDSLPVYFHRTQTCVLKKRRELDKVVVRPSALLVVWVHFILNGRGGYEREREVPESLGRSHHYRKKWKGYKGKCNSKSRHDNYVIDRFVQNVTGCFLS